MREYHLSAPDQGGVVCIDVFNAIDDNEAISLAVIRLPRADMKLHREGREVARWSQSGRIMREPEQSERSS